LTSNWAASCAFAARKPKAIKAGPKIEIKKWRCRMCHVRTRHEMQRAPPRVGTDNVLKAFD
jgi:hypothetical protein